MAGQTTRGQLLVWILLNIFLIAIILFLLDHFSIWNTPRTFVTELLDGEKMLLMKVEDPLLLEKEELKKARMSLHAEKEILKARERALEEVQNHHDRLILQVQQKWNQAEQLRAKFLEQKKEDASRDKNIINIADKMTQMPPAKAVERLEGLDSLLVIDIFAQMDKKAEEEGGTSVVAYYLSLMDTKKAQEILRLKAKFQEEEVEQQAQTSNAEEEIASLLENR